jgi:hypothetical protein
MTGLLMICIVRFKTIRIATECMARSTGIVPKGTVPLPAGDVRTLTIGMEARLRVPSAAEPGRGWEWF